MKRIIFISLILISFILQSCGQEDKFNQLNNTIITPHLKSEIINNKNIVFCSTFQLAWNSLKKDVFKEDIIMNKQPDTVNYLNTGLASKDDLSEESYLAISGFLKDGIVDKINKEFRKKLHSADFPLKQERLDENNLISFSYLYKQLQFNKEFENINYPFYYNSSEVKTFGIEDFKPDNMKHKKLAEQIELCDYLDRDNFVVKLKSKSENDEIILAKIKHEKTVLDTYLKVYDRVKKSKNLKLVRHSRLQIPKFNFNITHNYDELLNKNFKNKGFENLNFGIAKQNITFILDEKGAVLKSFSLLGVKGVPDYDGYALIFDKPFMLILKEKSVRYPYFIMWINNEELMVKY